MRTGTTTRAPLLLAGGGLIGLTVAALSLHVPGAEPSGLMRAGAVCRAAGCRGNRLSVRHPRGAAPSDVSAVAVPIVLAVAIAMRCAGSAGAAVPVERRVSLCVGWPRAGCRDQPVSLRAGRSRPGCRCATRRSFRISTGLGPRGRSIRRSRSLCSRRSRACRHTVIAMKLAMVAFEALACWAMLRCWRWRDCRRERVLIYAWNPLAVWEFAGNGHVDAIAIGLLAVALLAARRSARWLGRRGAGCRDIGEVSAGRGGAGAVAPQRAARRGLAHAAGGTGVDCCSVLALQRRRLACPRLSAGLFRRRGPEPRHRHLAALRDRPGGDGDAGHGEGLRRHRVDLPRRARRLDRVSPARRPRPMRGASAATRRSWPPQ